MRKAVLFKSESKIYKETFEKFGLQTLFVEALQFKFVNYDILSEKLTKEYTGIVLTSPRAIEAVSNCWNNTLLELWMNRKVYTVGEASHAKIKEMLKLSANGSESGNAEDLADIIVKENYAGTNFLFPCGNIKTETAVIKIIESGINVDAVTVYHTEENENLHCELAQLGDLSNCSMFFFSPSGAQFVSQHFDLMKVDFKPLQVFAIGNTTCKRLQELGFNVRGVASKPNPDCLIEEYKKCNE